MRRRRTHTGMLAAALSAAMAFTATTASATTSASYTVTPGGAFAGHSAYATWAWPYMALYCSPADVAGALTPNPAGSVIGTLNTVTFDGCEIAGIDLDITLSSGARPITATGTVTGRPDWVGISVSGVAFRIKGVGCTGGFGGTMTGHYDNDTGHLVVDGSAMTVSSANCLGLLAVGQPADVDADYAVTPHQTIQVS